MKYKFETKCEGEAKLLMSAADMRHALYEIACMLRKLDKYGEYSDETQTVISEIHEQFWGICNEAEVDPFEDYAFEGPFAEGCGACAGGCSKGDE